MKWSRCRGHPWTWGQGSNTPTAGFPAETYNLTLPLRWAADSGSKVSAECKARTQRVSGGRAPQRLSTCTPLLSAPQNTALRMPTSE